MLQDILALLVLADLKEKNETTDLLSLVLETATSENGDCAILLDNTCFKMQAVNLVSALFQIHGPVHLSSVLSIVVGPDTVFEVHDRRFNCELCINDESEDSLFLPVDCDIGGDVVTKRQFRGQAPFFRVEVIKLTATVLTATKHEQFLSDLTCTNVEDARCWAHSVFTEVGHWLGGLKFPVAVELDNVAS